MLEETIPLFLMLGDMSDENVQFQILEGKL